MDSMEQLMCENQVLPGRLQTDAWDASRVP